ncbi:MAG: hypothetical protein KAS23_15430, partial [Anaerohalosphaera sp.]|nr:hypothetical protein [Anaerohalosphaera sp.]
MDQKKQIEINKMILELLDGTITSERFAGLEKWLSSEEGAIEYYNDFMKNYSSLRYRANAGSGITESLADAENLSDSEVWQALAEDERNAETVEVEAEGDNENQPGLLSTGNVNTTRMQRQVSKLAVITAVLSSAAMLFLLVLVWFTPEKPPIVARLTKVS